MNRITVAAVLGLIAALPAGAAGLYFSADSAPVHCFAAPTGALRIADKAADFTVRIDNAATNPSLRLQIVDDPAIADFVLVDDDAVACTGPIERVRVDPAATAPDIVIALSRGPAGKTIYVNSAFFTEQDAAALFAVSTMGRRIAARHAGALSIR